MPLICELRYYWETSTSSCIFFIINYLWSIHNAHTSFDLMSLLVDCWATNKQTQVICLVIYHIICEGFPWQNVHYAIHAACTPISLHTRLVCGEATTVTPYYPLNVLTECLKAFWMWWFGLWVFNLHGTFPQVCVFTHTTSIRREVHFRVNWLLHTSHHLNLQFWV